MPIRKLTLDTLGDLADGQARAVINKALEEAARDVDDRGEDGKDRTVSIEVAFSKTKDKNVAIEVAARAKLPPRRTDPTTARVREKGDKVELYFQQWDRENPDQNTFPALDEEGGEVAG